MISKRFLVRYAKESEIIPRGYGVAWHDYRSQRFLLLPLPFNRIASACRELIIRLKRPWRDSISLAYQDGVRDGQAMATKIINDSIDDIIDARIAERQREGLWK